MRRALGIEYDGTRFNGWQIQRPGVRTVQASLQQALSAVADSDVKVVCAGRTDAGVHAVGQVVHFDTQARRTEKAWLLGTNSNLPPDVAVTWVRPVGDDFHARYCARLRRYRYAMYVSPARPVIHRHRVAWQRQSLDAARMHRAAQQLLGKHDFTSFRASECQAKHPVRRLQEINVRQVGAYVLFDLAANAFLHHMVRIIVGSLLRIGRNEEPLPWLAEVLAARDRAAAGKTADASGLCLMSVDYPEHYAIPSTLEDSCA